MTSPNPHPFIGRAADRELLGAVLGRLRCRLSATLVLSGDAGIGKTRLLQQLVDDADDVRAIMVSGYESEARLGFAALHRLVLPLIGGLSGLPAPQRDALYTALGLTDGPPPNRFLVGLATLSLLSNAAVDAPLLCVVDDVQWVDQETFDTLAFVARRLDAEGVGLVFGLRDELARSGLQGIPHHHLSPLIEGDMRALLAAAASTQPARHVATRLVTESQGNPLALLEYVVSLSPERLSGVEPLPPALPISERLTAGFLAQVAQLPRSTRRLLLVVSAAGVDDTEAVSAACARLGITSSAAAPAVRNAILSAEPRLTFRHPLIRSVVYDKAAATARRRVHLVLAEVADAHGFPDSAAWHRALATDGPDEGVATQLELTAARARERGGYAAEAMFLTLASQRSAEGTEGHSRRLLAAASAHLVAGDGEQVETLLDGLYPSEIQDARVVALRVAASWMANDVHTGREASILTDAANSLPSREIGLARGLRYDAFVVALETRQYTLDTSLRELARSVLDVPWPAGRERSPMDLMLRGLATRVVFGYQAAVPILSRGLQDLGHTDSASDFTMAFTTWMVMEDLWDDDFESTTWTQMTALSQAQGAWVGAWYGLGSSAVTEARHGNFDVAQDLFDDASLLSDALGVDREMLWSVSIEFRAWQGRVAETRSMADRLIHFWGESRRFGSTTNFGHMALSLLELSLGGYKAALAHAKKVADADPPGHGSRILPDLVEAAVRAGDETVARNALDELTMRATAAGTPWALGVLARARALTLGPTAEAEAHYAEALNLLEGTPLRTEIARTQLLYGEWLRRRRRRKDAREQLDASQRAFTNMGATTFARRASLELAATGAKPTAVSAKQPSTLTPQEHHVAQLAADGMTNSEISLQMFISDSTVDYHLSKVFRKLDVTSRRRLKDVLGS